MKINEIKELVKQVIAEAKKEKEAGLPKSGGKLVHLKKELSGLKKMQESVSQLSINEGDNNALVAEYAHMQKYVNDYNKIKEASASLSEKLGSQISVIEEKIKSETQKIKELMGLAEPVEEKKTKKAEPKKAEEEEKEEIEEARFEKGEDIGKPGAGFKKVAKAAEKEYGSKEAGQKVAGAILKKVLAKKK